MWANRQTMEAVPCVSAQSFSFSHGPVTVGVAPGVSGLVGRSKGRPGRNHSNSYCSMKDDSRTKILLAGFNPLMIGVEASRLFGRLNQTSMGWVMPDEPAMWV